MRGSPSSPGAIRWPASDRRPFSGASCQLRRFDGPWARELFLLLRPDISRSSFSGQLDSVYAELARALAVEGATPSDVLRETVLLGEPGVEPGAFLAARRNALQGAGLSRHEPATTLITQPSVVAGERLLVLAWAAIERGAMDLRTLRGTPPCACDACGRIHARAHTAGGEMQLWSGNIYGAPGSMFDETTDMFHAAGEMLAREGMDFRSVVRTWIYLRDIDRDYAELNRARRTFFERAGVSLHPASTGIQGGPCPARHKVSMSFHAFRPAAGEAPRPMTTPTLNEAPVYGSDFSRGMRLVERNKVSLHVSGTASVDEDGRTAHPGSFDAQVGRMLINIDALLRREGAAFQDVVTAVTYLQSASMARRYFEILAERGLGGFPHAIVEARVCRPDLLCEMEVQAALPVDVDAASRIPPGDN